MKKKQNTRMVYKIELLSVMVPIGFANEFYCDIEHIYLVWIHAAYCINRDAIKAETEMKFSAN